MMRAHLGHKNTNPRFHSRPGHRLDLLVDGQHFFPVMLEAIGGAHQYILLEMYLFESGHLATRFIDALLGASKRGVKIRVLIDDFGSSGLHAQDRLRLMQGGVSLVLYNPLKFGRLSSYFHRDHRKLLLIDGQIAFTGGSGITDDFDPSVLHATWWHDLMVRIEGPTLMDWQRLFERTWQAAGGDSSPLPVPGTVRSGPYAVRVTANDGRQPNIQRRLSARIGRARKKVYISVAYFVPPSRIRKALRHAARRGVDVRLILPGHHTDHQSARYAGRQFYAQLLRAGVRIYEYMPRFTHVKLMICDDWVSLGSANLDHWTLRWNLEANLEIEGDAFASIALDSYSRDLSVAREITLASWRARGHRTRIKEWFWGMISSWLARLRHRTP